MTSLSAQTHKCLTTELSLFIIFFHIFLEVQDYEWKEEKIPSKVSLHVPGFHKSLCEIFSSVRVIMKNL